MKLHQERTSYDKIHNLFTYKGGAMFEDYKKNKELKRYKKSLIDDFMKEHKEFIPKYSPKGMRLSWHIFVYADGEYDIYTGAFKGIYRVGIEQNPPYLSRDCRVYEYNINTKQLERDKGMLWQ
jgi:hypothetical protein